MILPELQGQQGLLVQAQQELYQGQPEHLKIHPGQEQTQSELQVQLQDQLDLLKAQQKQLLRQPDHLKIHPELHLDLPELPLAHLEHLEIHPMLLEDHLGQLRVEDLLQLEHLPAHRLDHHQIRLNLLNPPELLSLVCFCICF